MRWTVVLASALWSTACWAGGPDLVGETGSSPSTCEIPPMDELYPGPAPPNPYTFPPEAGACIRQEHDAIIVLGCPGNKDGTPSECQRERVEIAIELADAGYADHFIVSGAAVYTDAVEAETLRDLLVERRVLKRKITLEPRARHTDENIYYSSLLMKELGFKSALVVSEDPGHFIYTAICDANCCVKHGRLSLVHLNDKPVGYYVLDDSVTGEECSHIATLGMCMNLPSRNACAGQVDL